MGKKVFYLKWILLFMLYPFFLPTVVLCDIYSCGKDRCKEKPLLGLCVPCSGGDAIKVEPQKCKRLSGQTCEDPNPSHSGDNPSSPGSPPNKASPLPSGEKIKNKQIPAIDKP